MADHSINVDVNFGNANQNFQTLIDSMNKLQGIVTQLGTTIQSTNNTTSTSNTKAQKSITDYAGSYSKLSEDINKNRAELIKQLKILEELRAKYGANSAQVQTQTNALKTLETTIKKQTTTLSLYNKALGQTSAQAKATTWALGSLIKGFNSLGAVLGVSFGLYGGFRVLTEAIKTIADFDLAQKKLQSILAETDTGMKAIAQSAIDVGKNSIFGAKGVTELQIELAKMGFAKEEIIAMQGAIVNLATATQEELAPSAEVVANILRTFNLAASEATMVVDIMGKAFNDSALDLSNFRESIKYVAPIANQANFTFAETVSLLEQLSNAGIKGSLAGTGLTNIISRLGNENSKFVKTLGRTVNGFDDFLGALIELKQRGADLTDIFQLVDRRAAATFSILLDGVDTVEQFRKKLEESSGVMKEQAAVQLDSISYKARLLKESWKAMIIEMDESTNVITGLAKAFLNLGNEMIIAFGDPQKRIFEITNNLSSQSTKMLSILESFGFAMDQEENDRYTKSLNNAKEYYDSLSALESQYQKDAIFAKSLPFGFGAAKLAVLKNQLNTEIDEINKKFKGSNEELSASLNDVTQKSIQPYVDEFLRLVKVTGSLSKADEIQRGRLVKLQQLYPKASLNFEIYGKAIDAIIAKYDELNKTGLVPPDPNGEENKALKDNLQFQIDILEAKKKAAKEIIKVDEEGYNEAIRLAKSEYEYDLKILELKKQLYIANGQSITDAEKKNFAERTEAEFKYLNDVNDAWEKSYKIKANTWYELNDLSKKSLDQQKKDYIEFLDEVAKFNRTITEQLSEEFFKREEFKRENPIASLLGIGTEEDLAVAEDGFDFLKSQVTDLADSWVDSMDKIVDARNRMVDEAQEALQTELQLAELGFANNVTLKRKELEEAKKLREQAIDEQLKAQKVQLAVDTATQISSLTTSAAQLIASGSKFGIPGLLLAFGAITLMFSTFKKFQLLAQESAAQKFEKGGVVGGKRHSQGGTMIEAEQGEFVVNRRSAAKHKLMIEAINNDDTFSLNKMYINGLKNGVLKASVSLDDSEDIKAIRKALESKGKEVSYFGNYRIEKTGNITTKILMN